ncbi:MAG: bifunctional tetrahydrofolate synthase/dihydrofolate synthase [Burkholderiaceae bacterium]
MSSRTLDEWLLAVEALHPRDIEMGLDRSREVADRLGLGTHLGTSATIITVGGTNGKGSTCAMLESILLAAGFRVGLYIKPHFLRFNERARIDGVDASDADLIEQFEAVEAARVLGAALGAAQDPADAAAIEPAIELTYYEFTTLAILNLFSKKALDVVILEVGLGGRLDTVNLIDADCSVVTGIAIDHVEYLGATREAIAFEKAGIFRRGRPAICADPEPPASLIEHAGRIGADLWLIGRDFNYSGDRQQWNFAARGQRRSSLAYPALRGANQMLNASGALAALSALRDRLPVSQQAVRTGLMAVELTGRFQVLPGRPTVIYDVAHNPQAAASLAHNLDGMGYFPYTLAIFGAMRDKDIAGILATMTGRVDRWFMTGLPLGRAATAEHLALELETMKSATVKAGSGGRSEEQEDERAEILTFTSPAEAWSAARESAGPDDRIVAFGSFHTVAGVMKARDAG